jgi:SH3-like domain-containing protein
MKRIVFGLVLLVTSRGAYALCVTSERANLRKGPGPNHPLSWTVPRYTPLVDVRKVGSWYEVLDQDGKTHFVYDRNVTRKIQCAAVRVASASLRVGPGSDQPLGDIWKAERYTPFKRLDVDDNGWFQVEAPWGGVYWLSGSVVWRPVRVREITY